MKEEKARKLQAIIKAGLKSNTEDGKDYALLEIAHVLGVCPNPEHTHLYHTTPSEQGVDAFFKMLSIEVIKITCPHCKQEIRTNAPELLTECPACDKSLRPKK